MKFPFSRGNGRGHARANRLNRLAAHGTTSALPWQAAGVLVAAGILTQVLRPQHAKASTQTTAEPVPVPSALFPRQQSYAKEPGGMHTEPRLCSQQ